MCLQQHSTRAVEERLECATDDRVVTGSNPIGPALETLVAISFTPLCLCLSEETLKAVGPFYLVSVPEELKYPTQGVNM